MAEHIKQELAVELDRARAKLARNYDAFRHDVDVAAHLKKSVREHKGVWFGSAAALGLLLAKLPARKKKVYVERGGKSRVKELEKAGLGAGLALAAGKLLFSLVRPALTKYATQKITEFAHRRDTKT